jgi:DNA-directed RNA polymerase subunit RPC12/RpoP
VECDAARLAPQRLTNYPVTLGAHYTCPRCWIESETRSPLRGIPSTTRDDIFRCRQCGSDFTIPG